MIIKCPNCAMALEYDIKTDHMFCGYCGSFFDADFDGKRPENNAQFTKYADDVYEYTGEDGVEMQIYSCTSCGAQLSINGVESSTFCAYCGQPTIVFNRVSMMKRPKYIMPFKVGKEQAVNLIRLKLSKGPYVPDEIKNFSVDKLRGIYVPYYIVDESYKDKQLVKARVKSGKNTVTRYYYREGYGDFCNVPVDASKMFDNTSSQRLEPFALSELRDFNEKYLSGFYSDCSDEEEAVVKVLATQRIKELFDEEIFSSVPGSDKKIVVNDPDASISRMEYALLPVWFVVFRYKGKPYTMMVNGQTGKVVGAVPYEKSKVTVNFIGLAIAFSIICSLILYGLFASDLTSDSKGDLIGMCIFGVISLVGFGFDRLRRLKISQELTASSVIKKFASDRTEV